MGFVRTFWKNNIQEAYFPITGISWQIVSEILAQLCSNDSIITILLNLTQFIRNRVKSRRICHEMLVWIFFMTSHFFSDHLLSSTYLEIGFLNEEEIEGMKKREENRRI